MTAAPRQRLGDRLVAAGLIDQDQLRSALGEQRRLGKPLGRTLVELGMISEEALVKALADHLKLPAVQLRARFPLDPRVVKLLDEDFCRRQQCVAFALTEKGRFLDVAMADPTDMSVFDQIRVQTRCNVRPHVGGYRTIMTAIDLAWDRVVDVDEGKADRWIDMLPGEVVIDMDGSAKPRRPPVEKEPDLDLMVSAAPLEGVKPSVPAGNKPIPTSEEEIRALSSRLDSQGAQIESLQAQLSLQRKAVELMRRQIEELTRQLEGAQNVPKDALSAAERVPLPSPGMTNLTGEHSPPPEPSPPEPPEPPPKADAALTGRWQSQEIPITDMPPIAKDVITEAVPLPEMGSSPPEIVAPPPEAAERPSSNASERPPPDASERPPAASPPPLPPEDQTVGTATLVDEMPFALPDAADEMHFARPTEESSSVFKLGAGAYRGGAPLLAIDFGTSRSSVAIVAEGSAEVVPLPGGAFDMPSTVGIRADGTVMLGTAARKMLATDPANAIGSPKRLLGRPFYDKEVQSYLSELPVPATQGPDGEVVLHLRERQLRITEICAELIHFLKLIATRHFGSPIDRAVLTVPVSFTDRQRDSLSRAAAMAELEVLQLVEEPVAAVWSNREDPHFRELIALYDFGGGTFDFTVLNVGADDTDILFTAGDPWLGGDDFDAVVAGAVADAFWREHNVELRNQVVEWQRLLVAAERAKILLTDTPQATIKLENVALTAEGALTINAAISREQLAHLCAEVIQRSMDTCQSAMEINGIDPKKLSAIYLSGGTSLIPAVRDGVAAFFGKKPRAVVPPERAVLIGAAIYATHLQAAEVTL